MSTAPARPPALMGHQQPIFDFIVEHPFAGAWLGVGAGKTLTVLRALQHLRPAGHILVVAPVAIARSTWLDEIEKWQIPIRTKSLIADDNDRQLPRKKRLERFTEVFSDPPTMYFVNQELLTQPSQPTRLLTPGVIGPAATPEADAILRLARAREPLSQDELITEYRGAVASGAGGAVPAVWKIQTWIRELVRTGLLRRELHHCRTCSGVGCPGCRFGLVDQMPVQTINGQKTIIWPFQTVIIDESQGFKSHTSNRFKALRTVRPAITRLIELTGTPSPNGLHDLWSQVYLLDQGRTLGTTITEFRSRYFTPKMIPGVPGPAKWIPNAGAESEIHQAISHLVMSAQNTSLDLPEVTVEDVTVALPPDVLEAYKDFKRELVLDIVSTGPDEPTATVIAENQAVLTSKLMQFASGTLYTGSEHDGTAGEYEVIHDKKVEMADYLIRNTSSPVLVAYHFRADKEQIIARLTRAGHRPEVFDGSREMVRRWNDRKIPVMLLHPASAGHGLNLQHGGHTLIWYTLPFSLEHYLQTNGRLHRTGQADPVTIYRLITKDTQDARLPQVLAAKQRVQDDLIDAVDGTDPELAALADEINDDLNELWREKVR